MNLEFEVKINSKDLTDFKLYHNYTSVSGIATLLFGIIALIISVASINVVEMPYTLMMGFFGLFFTIYTPIGMIIKSKKQVKKVPAFKESVKYKVTDEKITLSLGEVTEDLPWSDIYKIKSTRGLLIVYITTVRANIIPVRCIGRDVESFVDLAKTKLKPFQVKADMEKLLKYVD